MNAVEHWSHFVRTQPEGWVSSPRGMRGFCILLQAAVLLTVPRAHAMPLVEQGEPRAALNELIAFRREHESMYIADYTDASRPENRWLDIDTLLSDE